MRNVECGMFYPYAQGQIMKSEFRDKKIHLLTPFSPFRNRHSAFRILYPHICTSKYPLLYHRHKIILKFFTDGDLFIGDVNVVILYFMKLFGIDNIGIMHAHKWR